MTHRTRWSWCIIQWEPSVPLRSPPRSLARVRGSASTFQGPSPTLGPRASISSPDGSHSTPTDLGMPAAGAGGVGQGHGAALLPLVKLGAQGGHRVTTSRKMVLTAGKPATWELPSPHPAYQFRFLLQEGESPTQGGLRECTVRRKERSRGRASSRYSLIQRLQHPRTWFLPLHLLPSFPSLDDSLVVIRWLQQLQVQVCGNENASF